MSRGKQASIPVLDEVARLDRLGFGPSQIHRELERQNWLGMDHGFDQRTVQRWVKELHPEPPDTSGPWSFAEATPEEAQLVGDIVSYVADLSGGKVWLTRELAGHVARVRALAPDIPAPWAYALARAYRTLDKQPEPRDARFVDLTFASRPWESPERGAWYRALVAKVERELGRMPRGLWVDVAILLETRSTSLATVGSFALPWPALPSSMQVDGAAAEIQSP